MSKSNYLENAFLALVYNNTNIANLGDATGVQGSTVPGNITVSLHTADPGEAGTPATSVATYTGYSNQTVARSGAGWTVSGNQVTNAASISFGACTAGSETITYWATSDGSGNILHKGLITDPGAGLAVSAGITPSFAIGQLSITED